MIISENTLQIFAVYENPSDVPEPCFLVRMWIINGDGSQYPSATAWKSATLEGARQGIPAGLYRLDRSPSDDPVLVETWL